MYSAEILLKTATIREVNSTEIDSYFTYDFRRAKHRITRHYSAKLQTTKQTFTTSKHSIEFAYSDFPCHLKDKLNRRSWTREKGRRRKIDQHDEFRPLWWAGWGNSARSRKGTSFLLLQFRSDQTKIMQFSELKDCYRSAAVP